MRSPALKAGLIGAGVLLLLSLLGLVPVPAISFASLLLWLLALVFIGGLAAQLVAPRREIGRCAGQGALAGLIAGGIGGIIDAALVPVQIALTGGLEAYSESIPAETLEAISQLGVDPSIAFGASSLLCCLPLGLLLGVTLGALGGAISAAVRPE